MWEERIWEVWTLTPWIPSNLVIDPLSAGGQGFQVCVGQGRRGVQVAAWMDFLWGFGVGEGCLGGRTKGMPREKEKQAIAEQGHTRV